MFLEIFIKIARLYGIYVKHVFLNHRKRNDSSKLGSKGAEEIQVLSSLAI
jgi:hypothetical protein